MQLFSRQDPDLISVLRHGGVGVLPTDTVYGIVASIYSDDAVRRLYTVRRRDEGKACLVLIPSIEAIDGGAMLDDTLRRLMERYWPGPVTIVVPTTHKTLYAPDGSIAYRIPADNWLQALLQKTGPLIAPSANLQGMPPALTLADAQQYFGDTVDFYVDGGDVSHREPSTLVAVEDGRIVVLRGQLPTEQ